MNATSPFDIQSAAIDTTSNLTDDDKFFVNIIDGEPSSEQIITVLISKSEYYKEDNQMYDDYGIPMNCIWDMMQHHILTLWRPQEVMVFTLVVN